MRPNTLYDAQGNPVFLDETIGAIKSVATGTSGIPTVAVAGLFVAGIATVGYFLMKR